MSNNKNKKRGHGYRHQNTPLDNPIRVRSKRLDEVDEDKISLAFWLLAKQLVEDQTDQPANDDESSDGSSGDEDADEVAA